MKRVLYLFGLLGVVALVIFIGYFFRYRSESIEDTGTPSLPGIPSPLPQAPPASGGLPTSTTIGTLPILETDQAFGMTFAGPVRSFFIDEQKKLLVVTEDGRIIRAGSSEQVLLSAAPVENLVSAEFSFDGTRVLVAFGDSQAPQTSVFDIKVKTWQPLPENTFRPAWAPKSLDIAYLSSVGEKLRLSTLDLNRPTSTPQTLIELSAEDLMLHWEHPEKILVTQPPSAQFLSSLWSFDTKKKTLTPLIEERRGLSSLWDENGNQGLVFEGGTGSRGGRLFLADQDGRQTRVLSFLTLPSKCVFSGVELLICAIPYDPQKLQTTALPDAYLKRAFFTSDGFYEIDLRDGNVKAIFTDPTQNLDAHNLRLFNQKLFFVNRLNGGLYAISLPASG